MFCAKVISTHAQGNSHCSKQTDGTDQPLHLDQLAFTEFWSCFGTATALAPRLLYTPHNSHVYDGGFQEVWLSPHITAQLRLVIRVCVCMCVCVYVQWNLYWHAISQSSSSLSCLQLFHCYLFVLLPAAL